MIWAHPYAQIKEDSAIRQEKRQRYSVMKYHMRTCLCVKHGSLLIHGSGTHIALGGGELTTATWNWIMGFDTHTIINKQERYLQLYYACIACIIATVLHHL